MRISAIINEIEKFAPRSLQEKWDNSGLQVGAPAIECTGVMICFDVTPEVVEEAIAHNCNLIISHHPLFFKPVRSLTGATPQQVCAINAIAAGIVIYSAHTSADSARGGVSHALAHAIGVEPAKVLSPLADRLVSLRLYVPGSHAEIVKAAICDAGAGAIGNYDCCSFECNGTGSFRPLPGSDPFVGKTGELFIGEEMAIDAIVPVSKVGDVERAIVETHPYETPAYTFTPTINTLHDFGLGVYGLVKDPVPPAEFVGRVKSALGCPVVRTTPIPTEPDVKIRRVAVCGGSGGEFIERAISMGAQAYVSADIRYHDFVDYRDRILLIDAGHYETEAAIKGVFADIIRKSFPSLDNLNITSFNDNPINYL